MEIVTYVVLKINGKNINRGTNGIEKILDVGATVKFKESTSL